MARPTKYPDNAIELAQQYLDTCKSNKLPTIEGLALFLDVDDETISEWAKIHPEFSATVKKVKSLQKEKLITDGFYKGKEVNAIMAIFLLKVNHGMIDTQKMEVEFKGKAAKKAEKDHSILNELDHANNNSDTENK